MHTATLIGQNDKIPVGKIVCLARNYGEHARELGNAVPSEPVLFLKPTSSLIADGGTTVIPNWAKECHHEVELALLIGKAGKNIAADEAMAHIAGYGVAIDFTLRDVQTALKEKGLPWAIAKGFDSSCPLSAFVPAAPFGEKPLFDLALTVNGESRQSGNSIDMLHAIPAIIAYVSSRFTLEAGDIILTGTPSGVGPVEAGETVVATIDKVGSLTVTIQRETK